MPRVKREDLFENGRFTTWARATVLLRSRRAPRWHSQRRATRRGVRDRTSTLPWLFDLGGGAPFLLQFLDLAALELLLDLRAALVERRPLGPTISGSATQVGGRHASTAHSPGPLVDATPARVTFDGPGVRPRSAPPTLFRSQSIHAATTVMPRRVATGSQRIREARCSSWFQRTRPLQSDRPSNGTTNNGAARLNSAKHALVRNIDMLRCDRVDRLMGL